MQSEPISFREISDGRGSLISLEAHRNIPFEIKRVYYIFGTPTDVRRGFHAHKSLEQVAICVKGSCTMLLDNGCGEKVEYQLNSPLIGLYIGNMIWREMYNFSEDCVLMVLASEFYDEADYIRNYQGFMAALKK